MNSYSHTITNASTHCYRRPCTSPPSPSHSTAASPRLDCRSPWSLLLAPRVAAAAALHLVPTSLQKQSGTTFCIPHTNNLRVPWLWNSLLFREFDPFFVSRTLSLQNKIVTALPFRVANFQRSQVISAFSSLAWTVDRLYFFSIFIQLLACC